MRFRNFLAILSFFLLLIFSQNLHAEEKIPMKVLASGHITVMAKINGKGPFRLVFDTGSPLTFINNRAAKAAGLVDKNAKESNVIFGFRNAVQAKSFKIGKLEVKNLPITILDHPTVEMLSKLEGRIDGLVGHSFFARFKMTLDYSENAIYFDPIDYVPEDVMGTMMKKMLSGTASRRVIAPLALWGFVVEKKDDLDGVTVTKILEKSPASEGFLRVGDKIVTINRRWTDSVTDVFDATAKVPAGKQADLVILRDGQRVEIKIVPKIGL